MQVARRCGRPHDYARVDHQGAQSLAVLPKVGANWLVHYALFACWGDSGYMEGIDPYSRILFDLARLHTALILRQ